MKSEKRPRFLNLSDALTADGCPLCAFLGEFQSRCLRTLKTDETRVLCSFHTWLVASVADARVVAEVFLRMLDNPAQPRSGAGRCDLCTRVAEEECAQIREFAERLWDDEFQQWLQRSGALCLPHARRDLNHAFKDLQEPVHSAVKRNRDRLRHKLTLLLRDTRIGAPIHAGILGRVAEYLAAHRGLGTDTK